MSTAVLLCAVFFTLTAVFRRSAENHVLLIGLDGATWKVLHPMLRRNELPHLNIIMNRGVYARIKTLPGTCSPVIWTSMMTGKNPEKHGIHDFIVKETGIPYRRTDRKVKALWNLLNERKKTAGIFNFLITYPAETVDGFVATDFYLYGFEDNTLYPRALAGDIMHQLPAKPQTESPDVLEDIQNALFYAKPQMASSHPPEDMQKGLLYRLACDTTTAVFLQKKGTYHLFAVYTKVLDSVQHRFWKYFKPEDFADPQWQVTPDDRRKYGEIIPDCYRAADRWIGDLLAGAPENTIVIIVSDHGAKGEDLRAASRGGNALSISGTHDIDDGIFLMAGGPVKKGAPVDVSVLDITPTILYLLGLPVARDMDGRVLTSIINERYLREHPVRYIDTYETEQSGSLAHEASPPIKHFEKKQLDMLKSVGYLQ